MVDTVTFAASLEECEVETQVSGLSRGYRFRRDDVAVRRAASALERVGREPAYILSGGGADANVFNERGLQCVNLANGMTDIHTPDERIAVADLRRDGRGDARPRRGVGRCRLASAAGGSRRSPSGTTSSSASRSTGFPASPIRRLTGPVELEDEVLVNVQARELELGSGGFDVLYANLTRGLELPAEDGAHVMVLPYTPLQHARLYVEESGELEADLRGLPVVCCSLHSQVAPVCAALGGLRVAYVQLAGRSAAGVALGHRAGAARAGPCRGDGRGRAVLRRRRPVRLGRLGARVGAAEGTTSRSARSAPGSSARARASGTAGSPRRTPPMRRSHSAGVPVIAVRASAADERPRHRGVSHHTDAVLVARAAARRSSREDGEGWREACEGLPLSHMGRGPDDDPEFFAAAYAAGVAARKLAH